MEHVGQLVYPDDLFCQEQAADHFQIIFHGGRHIVGFSVLIPFQCIKSFSFFHEPLPFPKNIVTLSFVPQYNSIEK